MYPAARRLMVALVLLVVVALASAPGRAADIRLADSPLCGIALSGPIAPGDTDRLRALIDQAGYDAHRPSQSETSEGLRLCLDSQGGSLAEAARLAEYVFETGIGTILAADATCLSACAWVFMLGHARGEEEAFLNRRMHHSARLGFQAPRIDLGDAPAITREDAEHAQDVMNAAVARLLQVSNARLLGLRPAIDADLLQAAFAHDGASAFFMIDNVDKAGRWQIEVFGFDWPEAIDARAAARACTSLTRWPAGRNATSPPVLPAHESMDALEARLPDEPDTALLRVEGLDSGYFSNECIIERALSGAQLRVCGINEGRATTLGHVPCDAFTPDPSARLRAYPALAIFAPETPLRDLPEAAARLGSRAMDAAHPRLHRACAAPVERLRVVRVNDYVTLRRQPGFQAEILARIPLGEVVTVTGEAVFAGEADRITACRAACRAAGTDRARPRPDIAACWLDNTLWLPARYGGQSGYVAGRFLAE